MVTGAAGEANTGLTGEDQLRRENVVVDVGEPVDSPSLLI